MTPRYQPVRSASQQKMAKSDNVVWPSGISDDDVDHLVQEVMDDPAINIPTIPDALERQIYRSTIKICLNALYHVLGDIQGKQLFGHEFRLGRWKGKDFSSAKINEHYRTFIRGDTLDDNLLEQVARRLLENKAINQRFLPDAIERKIYVNCLKLVFRLIGMIAASFCIVVCGHEIRLEISKARTMMTPVLQRAASSMTLIDKARLKEFALQAGIHEHELGENKDDSAAINMSWMERMMDRRRCAHLAQVHATLFGLILGVLDDMLANTRVELLSDRITLDIVPATDASSVRSFAQSTRISRIQHISAGVGIGFAVLLALIKSG